MRPAGTDAWKACVTCLCEPGRLFIVFVSKSISKHQDTLTHRQTRRQTGRKVARAEIKRKGEDQTEEEVKMRKKEKGKKKKRRRSS